ncbi:MAG: T9SS type A sorting domain-containing protein, partial [Bacteroidia bacterium]
VATVSVNPSPLVSFTLQADVVPHVWNALAVYSGGTPPYTVSWNWGDGNSTSALYPTHIYSAAGTYSICATITDANGCVTMHCQNDSLYRSANSTMVQVNVISAASGINTAVAKSQVKIYPNPACGNATIVFTNNGDAKPSLSVYSVSGQMIDVPQQHSKSGAEENITLNTSGLSAGIYYCKLTLVNQIITRKLIVNKP